MDSILSKLENILIEENGFLMKMRFLKGYDEKKLNDVLTVLKEVKLFYANTEFVPKSLALLLLELEPILWGTIGTYPESENEKIFTAIDKLSTAIRDCFI